MNIIEEIKKREQYYKKIIGNNDKKIEEYKNNFNLSNKALISFDYFIIEFSKKYPNLHLVRIITLTKRESIPSYQETFYSNKFEIVYAFIDDSALKNIMFKYGDLVFKEQKSYVIDLCTTKEISVDDVLLLCPIIIRYNSSYYNEDKYVQLKSFINELTDKTFPNKISLYPENFSKMECQTKTRFLLSSNNAFVDQTKLDQFCLEILKKLVHETTALIEEEIAIYQNIRNKLINGQILNSNEFAIIDTFLQETEEKIIRKNTILQRSLSKKEGKK